MIQKFASGTPWEEVVGYSRAIKSGNVIEVSGTTAMRGEELIGRDDIYAQTICVLENIEISLKALGGSLDDVVRTRMYVTDIGKWELVANAHQQFFGTVKPATSMVQVSALISPSLLIEIEATAIINPSD
jgi:enamine deaminase RidA (YjgF/YER057c/UK114 family)